MANLIKMLEFFLKFIKIEYSQDVAIVAYYGSYAQGTQNPNSDIDLFFIPSTDRGYDLANCIIYEGIGIDFFSISWDRAERIANYEENIVSVIADCKLLYSKSEKDKDKFLSLQKTVKSYQKPEKREEMLLKASKSLEEVYKPIYKINKSKNISEIRNESFHALVSILQAILMINQTYSKSGWGKNFNQIFSLPIKPVDLELTVEKIILGDSKKMVLNSLTNLFDKTEKIIRNEINKTKKKKTYAEIFTNFYEELKSTFLKVKTACEKDQVEIAFCSAAILQDEVRWCIQQIGDEKIEKIFKELEPLKFYDPSNLMLLIKATDKYEKELVKLLNKNDVLIKRINSLEEFQNFLCKKK